MSTHKFKAGQTVRVVPSQHMPRAQGSFRVVRVLPSERGMNQYRIKSTTDGHERVVTEVEVA